MASLQLNAIPEKEIFPGFTARIINTANMTLVYVRVKAGTLLPEHAHPQEQVTNLLEGRLELIIGGETVLLEPGIVGTIPSNASHSGRALTDCYILDIFHPHRSYT
jgi:quercetin dioxygenase-like cupin family protein